jgi:hypothetical protein
MNRYPPSTFRPAFGVAAVTLSALTFAVSVVLPVGLASTCPDATLAAVTAAAPVEVAINPARIDVVASPRREVVIDSVNVVARSRTRAG